MDSSERTPTRTSPASYPSSQLCHPSDVPHVEPMALDVATQWNNGRWIRGASATRKLVPIHAKGGSVHPGGHLVPSADQNRAATLYKVDVRLNEQSHACWRARKSRHIPGWSLPDRWLSSSRRRPSAIRRAVRSLVGSSRLVTVIAGTPKSAIIHMHSLKSCKHQNQKIV